MITASGSSAVGLPGTGRTASAWEGDGGAARGGGGGGGAGAAAVGGSRESTEGWVLLTWPAVTLLSMQGGGRC